MLNTSITRAFMVTEKEHLSGSFYLNKLTNTKKNNTIHNTESQLDSLQVNNFSLDKRACFKLANFKGVILGIRTNHI